MAARGDRVDREVARAAQLAQATQRMAMSAPVPSISVAAQDETDRPAAAEPVLGPLTGLSFTVAEKRKNQHQNALDLWKLRSVLPDAIELCTYNEVSAWLCLCIILTSLLCRPSTRAFSLRTSSSRSAGAKKPLPLLSMPCGSAS